MKYQNLKFYKGSTKNYEIEFTKDGVIENITDWKIYFTVKENMKDSDANAKIAKTISSHPDAISGIALIELSSSDTDIAKGNYYYSIDYLDDDGNEEVLFAGRLLVLSPVLNSRS